MIKGIWTLMKANPWIALAIILAVSGAIGGGIWYVRDLQQKIEIITLERDWEKHLKEKYTEALELAQKSSKRQIAALEKDQERAISQNRKLIEQLHRIDSNNEKITCALPSVLRDLIDRM